MMRGIVVLLLPVLVAFAAFVGSVDGAGIGCGKTVDMGSAGKRIRFDSHSNWDGEGTAYKANKNCKRTFQACVQ